MIPLVQPCITRRDRDHLAHACYNGLLDSEAMVRRFEEAFAERVGAKWAIAVCSGTEALKVAMPRGQTEPWIPSYACSAIANAAPVPGQVKLVDSNYDVRTATMAQDHGSVLVHMFGTATQTGDRRGAIEDVTLSFGADIPRPFIGVCSTHASKMLTTGRGGVIFGYCEDAFEPGFRRRVYYDQEPNGVLWGGSLGMTSMQAALGLSQLAQLDQFIERRREIAHIYSAAFEPAGIDCPDPDCGSVFFRYLIGVDDPAAKVEALAARGIEAGRGVYPPLHRQLGLPDEDFPGATACVNRLLSVPCHPMLTSRDVEFVAGKVIEVCA